MNETCPINIRILPSATCSQFWFFFVFFILKSNSNCKLKLNIGYVFSLSWLWLWLWLWLRRWLCFLFLVLVVDSCWMAWSRQHPRDTRARATPVWSSTFRISDPDAHQHTAPFAFAYFGVWRLAFNNTNTHTETTHLTKAASIVFDVMQHAEPEPESESESHNHNDCKEPGNPGSENLCLYRERANLQPDINSKVKTERGGRHDAARVTSHISKLPHTSHARESVPASSLSNLHVNRVQVVLYWLLDPWWHIYFFNTIRHVSGACVFAFFAFVCMVRCGTDILNPSGSLILHAL